MALRKVHKCLCQNRPLIFCHGKGGAVHTALLKGDTVIR